MCTYVVHGILDELDVVKAEGPVDETHAAVRVVGAAAAMVCSLEQRLRVSAEEDGVDEGGNVNQGVPREHEVGPDPRENERQPQR